LFTARVDVVHFHGVGNALFVPLVRLAGKRSVLTVDGPDWTRPKWGPVARFVLFRAATSLAGAANVLITDSTIAFDTYTRLFGMRAVYVPYGASPPKSEPGVRALEQRGLEPGRYFLYVGRLIPDKGVHFLIDAFTRISRDLRAGMKLAIVGDNPYFPEYIARLKAKADSDVQFLGYVYGRDYQELLGHAYAYVQPSSVEGTSPSLLAAMAFGRCVVVNGIPENRATIADTGLPFERDDAASLSQILIKIIHDPNLVADLGQRAQRRVRDRFDWDLITDQHERLYFDSSGGGGLAVPRQPDVN
jgi:glycosyltransferase involved in cell wall biosynthesis